MITDSFPPIYTINLHGVCDGCDAVHDLGFYSNDIDYVLPAEVCTLCGGTFQYQRVSAEQIPVENGQEPPPVLTQLAWPEGAPIVILPLDLYWSLFDFYRSYRLIESFECGLSGVHIHPKEALKLHDYCNHLDQYAAVLQSIVQEPLVPEE